MNSSLFLFCLNNWLLNCLFWIFFSNSWCKKCNWLSFLYFSLILFYFIFLSFLCLLNWWLFSSLFHVFCHYILSKMEMRGIDPLAFRMRNERSTIWATFPSLLYTYFFIFSSSFWIFILIFFFFLHIHCIKIQFSSKNASGGVRTHASCDSRSWDGPLRPLGHECLY